VDRGLVTADQRFTLIISGIGLLFVLFTALVGMIWRAGNRTGETLSEVKRQGQILDQHIQWHINHPSPPARRLE
jgi:hypothetical protein